MDRREELNAVELFAVAPDGWAITLHRGQFGMLRPPFRQEDRGHLSADQVERALRDEDFDPVDPPTQFRGWGELARHLQGLQLQAASDGDRQRAKDAAARLLAFATAEQVRTHIATLARRIQEKRLSGVEAVLDALLGGESARADSELRREIEALRGAAKQALPSLRAQIPRAQRWKVLDEASVDAHCRLIQRRGGTLAPAGTLS